MVWNNYGGGSRYHGRGLIQLTHDTGYKEYGKYSGNDNIETDPDIVSHNISDTVNSACWYWRQGSKWGDINPKADANDFFAVTVAVNGGFNHVGERFEVLVKLSKLLETKSCSTVPGMDFSGYKIDKSALFGTKYYKNHQTAINLAQSIVDEKAKAKK